MTGNAHVGAKADQNEFHASLGKVVDHIIERYDTLHTLPILPTSKAISSTLQALPSSLPEQGLGTDATTSYLIDKVLPGILQAQPGPRYFGFVVGGVTPAAQLADILSTSYDENVQVNLNAQTASTAIEQRALELVLDLLEIKRSTFMGRTITTGATSANVLGLACARDHLYAQSPHLPSGYSYAQDGPPYAPGLPSPPIIILSLHPHFSIAKAASLVGIGSSAKIIHSMPPTPHDELAFDLQALEERLKAEKEVGRGVIVIYGVGEVNTGGFGCPTGLKDVAKLCKACGAWLHVDAAFGGFAGLMPDLQQYTRDMDQADSLTLDGHKWLNVPYDCGLFFTRHSSTLTNIFQPPSASAPAYLAASSPSSTVSELNKTAQRETEGTVSALDVPSPLYVGIENSRRFRALPLLASLLSLGKEGYRDIITRNIHFARQVAQYIHESPNYELLNLNVNQNKAEYDKSDGPDAIIPSNIVLFRLSPKISGSGDGSGSGGGMSAADLATAINRTGKMYVSATKWRGEGAVRIAVSNWSTALEGRSVSGDNARDGNGLKASSSSDFEIVRGVLEEIGRSFSGSADDRADEE